MVNGALADANGNGRGKTYTSRLRRLIGALVPLRRALPELVVVRAAMRLVTARLRLWRR